MSTILAEGIITIILNKLREERVLVTVVISTVTGAFLFFEIRLLGIVIYRSAYSVYNVQSYEPLRELPELHELKPKELSIS